MVEKYLQVFTPGGHPILKLVKPQGSNDWQRKMWVENSGAIPLSAFAPPEPAAAPPPPPPPPAPFNFYQPSYGPTATNGTNPLQGLIQKQIQNYGQLPSVNQNNYLGGLGGGLLNYNMNNQTAQMPQQAPQQMPQMSNGPYQGSLPGFNLPSRSTNPYGGFGI
jgi:hypothetical protein